MLANGSTAMLSAGAVVMSMGDDEVEPDTNPDDVRHDDIVAGPSDTIAQGPAQVVRPPFGDATIDPLTTPSQVFVAVLPEQNENAPNVLAEPAVDPEDLVMLTNDAGAVVSVTLEKASGTVAYAGRDFTITAPDTAENIVVEYNAAVAFQIIYTEDTETVSAGLNSNIQSPYGRTSRTITNEVDLNGVDVMTLSFGKCFGGSTDITLVVDQEQIGAHLAQIDLANPGDTLAFEFDSTFTGNLHLVYDEREDGTAGDTSTTKRAFVIQTAANVTSLSEAAIADLIAAPDGQTNTGTILSEIYLGTDSLEINRDPTSGMEYQVRIENFINETPAINTNLGWTSISEHNSQM